MSAGLIDLLNKGHWGFFEEQQDRKKQALREARERLDRLKTDLSHA